MSLDAMALTQDAVAGKVGITLKTADQYDVWQARVADVCWAATHRSVFEVTDDECKHAVEAYLDAAEKRSRAKKGDDTPAVPQDWVGKCWLIITTSLHDDVYRKLSFTRRGAIASLIKEIRHALVVNNLEEVPPLRLELYGGSMQKDCGSDLQAWVSFVMERAQKLAFLKHAVPDDELTAIFLDRKS